MLSNENLNQITIVFQLCHNMILDQPIQIILWVGKDIVFITTQESSSQNII